MAANKQESGERYNPITGIGIPATPARTNSSAIFGGSPSSIEYMFIPPSASTRSTKPPSSSEKRRSLSRESLRRSFPRVSEGQPDSDECSSVSDVSECGSEAEQRDRSRSKLNALPRTGKPLSRSTSSRLPVSVARPRVMKRAHSFTRETINRSPRGTTDDPEVTHSASELTNQLKKPNASAASKIPKKPTTTTSSRTVGPQVSRLPVKRADVNSNTAENGAQKKSGNQSTVVKRTEPQVSGIPVKPSTLQKRTTYNTKETSETEATPKKTTATGSGIPVKGSGTKPQQHSGSSRIPHLKLDGSQVGTSYHESELPKENIDSVNDDIKTAMQAGKPLLQREGTGDELRPAKADAAKSKLPRRSSIPRSGTPKVVQKMKNGEKPGKEPTCVKIQQTVKSSESSLSGSKVRTAGVSKIPVNKRVEAKPANRSPATPSSMSQGSDSGYGDTDSVSGKEDAPEEIGNEFCLSRENSKSKIPIMSRKGRAATKTSEAGPNQNEVVGVSKEKIEKAKQESRPSDDSVSKESEITEQRSVSGSTLGVKEELTGKTSITRDSHVVAMQQPKVREPDVVLVTGKNKPESESRGSADERLKSGLGPSKGDVVAPDTLPNKELVTVATKSHRVQREPDNLHEREGLVTRKDNGQVGSGLVPRTHAGVPDTSISDQSNVSSNNGYCYTAEDVQEMASVGRHDASLLLGNQDNDVDNTKKKTGAETQRNLKETEAETRSNLKTSGTETRSNLKEPGAETRSNLKEPGAETRNNLKRPGAETRSNLKEPGKDSRDVNRNANKNLKTETRGLTAGTTLEGKNRIRSKECFGDVGMENKNSAEFKIKGIVNEKHDASYHLEKETERHLDVQTRHLSELDKRLGEPGIEMEEPGIGTQEAGAETEEPAKRSDTCFECRMEKSENEDEKVDEMDDNRRYPTFISPRKSLVLCKHHEKLKNEPSQSADDLENHLVPMTSLPAVKNGHVSVLSLEASPEILPKNPTNRGHVSTVEDKLANHASKRGYGVPAVVDKSRETPKLKNVAPIRGVSPVSKKEPSVKNIDQRRTAQNNAREKDAKNVGGPKGSHSPLLALSRDKKFVSRENLATPKNTENIKSALSLEWDDIGTELNSPNFSEDDDEDISEPGVKKPGQDKGDSRGPGVKLMNTNEALDKLKVIQSLIMKEAENRSRKESEESAGKYAVAMKGPGNEQNVSKNIGMHMSPPLEKQRTDGYQKRREEHPLSNQVSPTSEVPRRKISSPTIWDKISDNTISQDQTTELLNETLAKLKASPQLSNNAFARRTISSRSLPGSRQASKEQLLSDTERPVYVYTSSWMNRSGKNSRGSSLSLCSANRSLPSSRQNLAKDPFNALKRSESASGRIMEKENGKRIEGKEKKEFRLSDFDEINLSDDGMQELKNQKSNKPSVSPVVEKPRNDDVQDIKPSLKMSKRRKKSKNTAATMNNVSLYGVSMEDLADGKATCQCGGKKCVIS